MILYCFVDLNLPYTCDYMADLLVVDTSKFYNDLISIGYIEENVKEPQLEVRIFKFEVGSIAYTINSTIRGLRLSILILSLYGNGSSDLSTTRQP